MYDISNDEIFIMISRREFTDPYYVVQGSWYAQSRSELDDVTENPELPPSATASWVFRAGS